MVHVLNVEPPLDDYGMISAYMSRTQHNRQMRARANDILRRALAKVRSGRARIETHAAIGDVAETIAKTARRLGCDCIVMGARGMSLLGSLALGSVSTKVIHHARVPVTIVK